MPWTMTDSERIFSFNRQWCGPSADTSLTATVAQIGSGTWAFGRLLMNGPCKGTGWFMGAAWASSSGTARSQHGVIGYRSQLKAGPFSKPIPSPHPRPNHESPCCSAWFFEFYFHVRAPNPGAKPPYPPPPARPDFPPPARPPRPGEWDGRLALPVLGLGSPTKLDPGLAAPGPTTAPGDWG